MIRHLITITLLSLSLVACENNPEKGKYHIDGSISEEVLNNYLSRAITMGEFCLPNSDAEFEENVRMLKNIGAKFIGRAAFEWTPNMNVEDHFAKAAKYAKLAHEADPEFLLQVCIFEAIFHPKSRLTNYGVDSITIPEWVFKEFGLPVQIRNFSFGAMIYADGKYNDRWAGEGGGVPDISRIESQMYFYYRAVRYINAGFEGIHFGQIQLMDDNDPDNEIWFSLLKRIREYAKDHARRGWVVCDSHACVVGGYVSKDGYTLLDFHSSPQRPKEICDTAYHAVLEAGYLDAMFKRSKGGITPSGWECESLPYLIEFDNSGKENPGVCGGKVKYWPWGWDEISWFAHCAPEYRAYWLNYATEWLKENDPAGHLQMPGAITIAADPIPIEGGDNKIWKYRLNNKTETFPHGFSDEDVVKKLWEN